MPPLPDGQKTPEFHRYPFFQLARQSKQYFQRIPLDRAWYNMWSPGRVERCWEIFREKGTEPPRPVMCRICDDYYVDADGNHRLAFWDQRGDVDSVIAELYTARYREDVLSRAILKDGGEMWVYKEITYVPTHDTRWVLGIHWYRELIRQDVYDWLLPIWQATTNFRNDWKWFVKKDAAALGVSGKVMMDAHAFSPYHSRDLKTDILLEGA